MTLLIRQYRYNRKQSVPILVGPGRERYYVYKDLLAANSSYFAAQFKKCWDGTKSEIELLDADQEAFELVVDWMYTEALLVQPQVATASMNILGSPHEELASLPTSSCFQNCRTRLWMLYSLSSSGTTLAGRLMRSKPAPRRISVTRHTADWSCEFTLEPP